MSSGLRSAVNSCPQEKFWWSKDVLRIDEHEGNLSPLRQFILPAGDAGATHLHLARAICRRAERRVVTLVRRHETRVSEELIIYLNRLSDFLFVLTRSVNQIRGVEDVQWVKPV